MTKANAAMLGMAAGMLLAGWAGAQVMSAVSSDAALDTRSLSAGRGTSFRPVRAKAASRGIPLAAALQIRSPDLRSIGIGINCSF